jgi:hypothetical protein
VTGAAPAAAARLAPDASGRPDIMAAAAPTIPLVTMLLDLAGPVGMTLALATSGVLAVGP